MICHGINATNIILKKEKTLELLTIKQASEWASENSKKKVTPSNISYLI
jgi:hypothetical protein